MTKIKLCGLSRSCDIDTANQLKPEYIGFVFAPASRRYVTPDQAAILRKQLAPGITAVGVFVNEQPEVIAKLLFKGIIDIAQLHGHESADYIQKLRSLTDQPIIQAFRIENEQDINKAVQSPADYILLDSGSGGTGTIFNWQLIQQIDRPYFLAGGLDACNVGQALEQLTPFAVDVSSGIESSGCKDPSKMTAFVQAVRDNR